jgi:hypothetical protein
MKIFIIILLQVIFSSCNENKFTEFSDDFNILYLPESIDRIAKSYYNYLIVELNEQLKRFNDYPKFKELKAVVDVCIDDIKALRKSDKKVFYDMYLSTGWTNSTFGDYERCNDINKDKPTKLTTFVIVENFDNSTLKEKVISGICVPYKCNEIVNLLKGNILPFEDLEKNLKLRIYPDKDFTKDSEVHFMWFFLLVGVIGLVILANIIMNIIYDNHNPYDVKTVTFESKGSRDEITRLSDIQIDTSALPNITRKQKCLNIFYNYFSLSNNLFLLTQVKSPIYNDKGLRFVYGLAIMYTFLQIFTNLFSLVNTISRVNNTNFSIIHSIYDIASTFGKLYIEFINFLFAFIITFKYLCYTETESSLKGFKIIFWLIRQMDKLVIFIFVKLIAYFSMDIYMHMYNQDCMLWFLYDKYNNECSLSQVVPFIEFIYLLQGSYSLNCMNSNRIYLQLFYIFLFTCMLLYLIRNTKYKLTILSGLLVTAILIRVLFTIFFINEWYTKFNFDNLRTSQLMFDYLHSQFFYNWPNLLLGIITGYIYYLDKSLVKTLEKSDFDPSLQGLEKIRYFFATYTFRNFLFIFSLVASTIYFGMFNSIEKFINNEILYFFILAINGVFGSFMLGLLILTVKIKSQKVWFVNRLIINYIKKLIRNDTMLVLSRCYFCAIIGCTSLIYYYVLNLARKNPIYYDFFNVILIIGIPLTIIIFICGFILTVFVELPLRILLKKIFNIKRLR